jgi:K+-transporting ATPase c subunit
MHSVRHSLDKEKGLRAMSAESPSSEKPRSRLDAFANRHPQLWTWLAPGGFTIAVWLIIFAVAYYLHPVRHVEQFPIPDESKVALSLLAEKFAGPRYFQAVPSDHPELKDLSPTDATNPYVIRSSAAHLQVDGIVKERHMTQNDASKLHLLIDQLTQPSASRESGTSTVNLLKLNLALDAMR